MTWLSVVAFALALVSIFAGQYLRKRAALQLTPVQREQVLGVGYVRRAARTILVFGIMLWLVPIALLFRASPPPLASWPGAVVAAVVGVWLHVSYFRKLRALGLPESYVRAHEHARYVVYAGFFLVAIVIFLGERVGCPHPSA